MTTECTARQIEFQGLGRRKVIASFDGGAISSDGGSLLLREVEQRERILERFAACFTDHRAPELIEHTVKELVTQRVHAIALGYEDLNDHDALRHDPLLAVAAGKKDPTGSDRRRESDRGKALAGKSTLNRVELTGPRVSGEERYKKVALDMEAVDALLVDYFLECFEEAPAEIVLDIDATNDPVHGKQEGRYFQGYYDEYCYLPLYVFSGEHLLLARLRPGWVDGAEGALEELKRIVERIRRVWPKTRIIIRGDSGFCREAIMAWCERTPGPLYYVFGLAKNPRLEKALEAAMIEAVERFDASGGQPQRVFREFRYRTRKSWSRTRRVIGKAEFSAAGDNPRFVVTNLSRRSWGARALYEELYCARGDMENRIKEQQLFLFADRTSTRRMRSNQIRLYFSSITYVLMSALRRIGLAGTELARAQCNTIRLKLLKIGALVRITVRKVWVSFSGAYPYQRDFLAVFARLTALQPQAP